MTRRTFLLFGSLWLAVSAATGQPAPKISVEPLLSVDKLSPGTRFQIAVFIELGDPWHVNANPASSPDFIPTVLTFEPPDAITIHNISYPKGKPMTVSWADQPVTLYAGHVVIIADGRVRETAPLGRVKIAGALRYQACDDAVCLAPKSVPVTIDTEIASESKPVHAEIFRGSDFQSPPVAVGSRPHDVNAIDDLIRERGWWFAFFVVFLGGLALNLTPCVYPMIAITVSYFGGQGERSTGSAFRHALVYFFGVTVTYSSLGLAAALTGGLFGSWLQSPAMLIVIAAMLVALALSLFGLYENQPPQFF